MTLPSLAPNGRFSILSLENISQWSAILGLDLSLAPNQMLLRELLRELITALSPHASALSVDPELGLSQLEHKAAGAGVLLPLAVSPFQTQPAEIDPLSIPSLSTTWGIEQIANNYGAAYLELFYHPHEPQALLKKQMVAELYDYALYTHLHLVIRLRQFSPMGQVPSAEEEQTSLIQTLQELRNTCHAFILDAPTDVLSAATITAELDVPWLVWLDSRQYEPLKELLRTSTEGGAKGFMISDSLWPELGSFRRADGGLEVAAMTTYIQTSVRDRVIELARIVAETVA